MEQELSLMTGSTHAHHQGRAGAQRERAGRPAHAMVGLQGCAGAWC